MLNKAVSPATDQGPRPTNSLKTIISHLSQVQADLTEVITFLATLAAPMPNTEAQKSQIQQIIGANGDFIRIQLNQIKATMCLVYKIHGADEVADFRSDITEIENRWERLADFADLYAILQSPSEPLDVVRINTRIEQCKALKREIGLFSIPKRLPEFMREGFGVGAPLDFHAKFKQELDDAVDRGQVLYQLAELDPDCIGGVPDVGRGMIYRIGNKRRRLWSYGMILSVTLLGLLIIYVLRTFELLPLPGFTGEEAYPTDQMLWAYVLLAVGVIAHIIKKAAELSIDQRTQGAEAGAQVVLDRLLIWIHIREYRFLFTVLTAIGVFILLATIGQLNGLNALLAGYTVDSLSDLFLQRFNTAVSVYSRDLEKALSAQAGI